MTRWRNAILIAAGVAFVLAAAVLLPRYTGDIGLVLIPLGLVGFAAVVGLFLVPTHALPAIALTVFALLPSRVLPQDGPLGILPITTAVLVVWAFRRLVLEPRAPRPASFASPMRVTATIAAASFAAWTIFSLARSVDVQTSTGWTVSFFAGALLPFLIVDARREADLVRRTWISLGGVLGAYALIEGLLQANPIWGTLYSVVGIPDAQRWSTYRSEASFGHPLFAALFFAVACALAIGYWLSSGSRFTLAAAVLSGLGLVMTVSRGALVGAGVAVLVAYFFSMLARREKRWNRYALLAALGVVGAIGLSQFDALAQRNDSAEAELSSYARDLGVLVAFRAAEFTGWIGSGPGTSGITGRLFDDVVIENSGLQLLISVGIPGVILFVVMVATAGLNAIARGAVGSAAGMVAYLICVSGFNAIDALRPMHLLLGCLLILTLNPDPPDAPLVDEGRERMTRRRRAVPPTARQAIGSR